MVVLHIFNLTYLKGLKLDFFKKKWEDLFWIKKINVASAKNTLFFSIRKLEKGSGDRIVRLQKIPRPCWDTETLFYPDTTDTRATIRTFAMAGAF